MNPPISSTRIEWPQTSCQLLTGALGELLSSKQLSAAVGKNPTSQVLLRDASVPFEALEPVRDWLARRAPVEEFELAGGESVKTPDSWSSILELFATAKLDRGGLVIVAGGGALGDAAGFAASIWQRGVPWVAIPTTLLAMVDAHIGGKTAINHGGVKNRIGSFHLPRVVLTDPALLDSLPLEERMQGWAELIKAAWIGDPVLLTELESDPDSIPPDKIPTSLQIAAASAVKVAIVGSDPFEYGPREVLNFGHTFAHALEMNSAVPIRHGEAVSRGMVFAATLAEEVSITASGTATRISDLLQRVGLPVDWSQTPIEPILASLLEDKKVRSGTVRWVLPREPGDMVVESVPQEIVERLLRTSAPAPQTTPGSGDGSHEVN